MPNPESVAHYLVERELGRGAMGVVLLARDTRLGRLVAIKSLPEQYARDAARRARIERESRILAAINHPNVAAVYGLEEAEGSCYIVLELADGLTLAERLAPQDSARRALPIDETLDIGRQIAAGLDAAHRHGIVHRDLKPANIKIRPDGLVKILDFGIAMSEPVAAPPDAETIVSPPPDPDASAVAGTPGYMSPEQVRGLPLGPAADVWAFGCVMFECLTGSHAFEGDTIADVLAATLAVEPDWTRLPGQTPEPVAALLRACLRKDPAQRPAGISTVAAELDRLRTALLHGLAPAVIAGASAAPPCPVPSDPTPFVGREREAGELHRLLHGARLVTITGIDGCGKTRLAMHVARAATGFLPCWAPLAPVVDADLVVRRVARALRLSSADPAAIASAIGGRPVLLLLDGCSHAPSACASVTATLLGRCPGLRVLATGRDPLGLPGESMFALAPMEAPRPDQSGGRFEAASLFLRRARAATPAFSPNPHEAARIAALCRALGGLPLAVELAAAALGPLPVIRLADGLEQRLRLAGSPHGLDEIMRLVIDWRYDRLAPAERGVLKRLALFPAGTTTRRLTFVCGADDVLTRDGVDTPCGMPLNQTESGFHRVLEDLDRAGLVIGQGGQPGRPETCRWTLLDPVRDFALQRLAEAGEHTAARDRYVTCCEVTGAHIASRLEGPARAFWGERLDEEAPNIVAAAAIADAARGPGAGDRLRALISPR